MLLGNIDELIRHNAGGQYDGKSIYLYQFAIILPPNDLISESLVFWAVSRHANRFETSF